MNDFFRLPLRGRFDGSIKLWFLRRRCVLCRPPRICGAQAKIVGENRRSHPAEKTRHTWALGTRGADRPFRYPPSPPVIYGAIFDPPSNSDPPSYPPLGLATGADELAHAVALGLKPGPGQARGQPEELRRSGHHHSKWHVGAGFVESLARPGVNRAAAKSRTCRGETASGVYHPGYDGIAAVDPHCPRRVCSARVSSRAWRARG